MRKALFVSLLALAFSVTAHAQLAINSDLPDGFKFYKLADSSGFTQENFQKGKKSLIIFFDASCEHCQHEMDAIGKRFDQFKAVNLYLVSMDEKPAVERFMDRYAKPLKGQKNVTLLLDPNRNFMQNFQPERFPAIYVYSADRKLTWHKDGQREVDDIVAAIK